MKYCNKCRKEIDTDQTVCTYCGCKLQEVPEDNSDDETVKVVSTMTITVKYDTAPCGSAQKEIFICNINTH